VGRSPNPVGRGARAGAERAVNDAREFLAGVRTSFEASGFDGVAFETGTTAVANGALPV
jgi:hypothetical protein